MSSLSSSTGNANQRDLTWSPSEKAIARKAFDAALSRELHEVIPEAKQMASQITQSSDLWDLEHYLTQRRTEIDRKYDYRRGSSSFQDCEPTHGLRMPARLTASPEPQDQGCTDDTKYSRGDQQILAFVRKVNCHDCHDGGMGKIQPCGEGDHAAIRRRIRAPNTSRISQRCPRSIEFWCRVGLVCWRNIAITTVIQQTGRVWKPLLFHSRS